jgi:transporter family protein
MSWIQLSILSAVFLGIYDLLKKSSVRENAVLPVLFIGVLVGALAWVPCLIWSTFAAASFPTPFLFVDPLSPREHGLVLVKSSIVGASWLLGYFAVKHLPVSIASPIRSTSPLWTILIAVIFLNERPSLTQWTGVFIVLGAFYSLIWIGRLEGIHFMKDRWVGMMIGSALISSVSAIYDKYLLQSVALSVSTLQCWFSIYLVVALLPFFILWFRGYWARHRFEWRWTIPLVGVGLLIADFMYFTALRQEGAMVSVISPVRRSAVIISFLGGIGLFREKNFRLKSVCILVLLLGVGLLSIG